MTNREKYHSNNTNNNDTDGDTSFDGSEVGVGTDPLDPCDPNAMLQVCLDSLDTDGDGLTAGEEAALGTDPALADTDGDTVEDGAEVTAGSDPLDPCDPDATVQVCLDAMP